jgi:RNA polymerase sigma-70 factor (ECF subfamily)
MRYTKNEQDAVEVLNTGFLKVFRHINKYEESLGSMYTWIARIVINSCLDHIKRNSKDMNSAAIENATQVEIPPEAISKISSSELLRLVRHLPPATQAVFNLYVIDGYNHKEIAGLLGIKEGTSKWHLSEARKALQKIIQSQEIQSS